MNDVFVLGKDYGSEGHEIHGCTESIEAAKAWLAADSSCCVWLLDMGDIDSSSVKPVFAIQPVLEGAL